MTESKLGSWVPRRLGKVRGRGQNLKGRKRKGYAGGHKVDYLIYGGGGCIS